MSCSRVICVQLAVGGAHHLWGSERQCGGILRGTGWSPASSPAPWQPQVVARPPPPEPPEPCPARARARSTGVPARGKRTVPSPSQRCSASALSAATTPAPPHTPPRPGVAGGPVTLLAAPHHPSAKPSTQTQLSPLDPKPWHCWALWGRAQRPPHRLLPAPRGPARSQAAGPGGTPGHRGRGGLGTGNGDLPENPSAAPAKPGAPWGMRRHRQAAWPHEDVRPLAGSQSCRPTAMVPSQRGSFKRQPPRNEPGDP